MRDDKIAELVRRARPVAAAGQGNKDGSDKTGKPKNDAVTVAEVLQRAHALNPDDIEIASGLVDVYRNKPRLLDDEQQALPQADRNKLADQVVDDVVTASPQSAKAYLARYRYRADLKLPNAADDLAAALKYGPDDPEVLLNAGLQAMRNAQAALGKGGSPKDVQAKLAQASKYYEHAAEVAPADERAYLKLAGLYGTQGKPDDAVKWLRTGLEKGDKENVDPKSYLTKFALNSALADLLIGQGKLDDAEKTLGELERVSKKVSPFLTSSAKVSLTHTNDLLRGKWLVRKGQYAEAIPRLRLVAVGQLPAESFQAWKLLGIAYGAIGQWDQAATAYEQAAATAPKSGQVRRQAAAAWAMAGRSDVAAAYYKQALDLDRSAGVPVAPQTLLALARVEYQQILRLPKEERHWDSFDRALAEAQKAQSQTPTDEKRPAEAWALKLLEADYNLGSRREGGKGPGGW